MDVAGRSTERADALAAVEQESDRVMAREAGMPLSCGQCLVSRRCIVVVSGPNVLWKWRETSPAREREYGWEWMTLQEVWPWGWLEMLVFTVDVDNADGVGKSSGQQTFIS